METRIRAAALIMEGERVLLVTGKKGRADYLVLPGGGLEPPESLAEAAVREAFEEAGITVTCGALVGYRELLSGDRLELEFTFSATLQQNPDSVACVSEENRRVEWVDLSALPQTRHFPERLDELCRQVLANHPTALFLGRFTR